MRKSILGLTAIAILAPIAAEAASSRNETLRATLRQNGHECGRVISAQKDMGRSNQNRTIWYVDCDDARYQLRYNGDSTAQVVPLLRPRRPSR